jgi:soluble lytic murein transglycosylase-like protein
LKLTYTPWNLIIGVLLFGFLMADAKATCYKQAADSYKVNARVLKAIALTESGENPLAVATNTNKTEDIGLMQINSIHLPGLVSRGIGKKELLDGCTNVKVAAQLLREKMDKWGNGWRAIGAYHSETPHLNAKYQARVYAQYTQLVAMK